MEAWKLLAVAKPHFYPSSWSGMFGAEFLESHRKAIETLVKQYGMAKKRPQTNSVLTNKEFPLASSISNSPQEPTINKNTKNIQHLKGKKGIRDTVYPPLRGARKSAQLEHHHQNLLNKTGKSRSFCISPWICNPGDMQNQHISEGTPQTTLGNLQAFVILNRFPHSGWINPI
jgi:hypothetical protein